MKKLLSVLTALALVLTLAPAALASGSHDCADTDGDHLCDECWESMTALCTDVDGDHYCDLCWASVRTDCTDGDGDEYCDVCWSHMSQYCVDADDNHVCDVCWTALSTCLDEDKNHLCDTCGGVFWVDDNADGVCDGCEAVLTHVSGKHKAVYYHESKGTTLTDVVIEVTVQAYVEEGGTPAGTVAVCWTDEDGNSFSTADKALTFGATTVTVEYPGLPLEALEKGGRVTFTPYDAGFTPAENGCVIEYHLPALWIGSDAEFTVNGVQEYKLYLHPGTEVSVVQQPGPTESWEWVFEEGYAVPEVTVDGLVTTFVMPDEDVNMYAAWRCALCADGDGDGWCDVCGYGINTPEDGEPEEEEPAGAWYDGAVEYVLDNGLMESAEDGFDPMGGATRSDFVTALWKMAGSPVVNYLMQFADVESETSNAEAIRWAAAMGITNGYPDGTFRPGNIITRQEMATFLYRYEQHLGGGFTGAWMFLLDCTDWADVSEWAYESLCWLTMNDIMNGDGTGALKPQTTATRAEMAQILVNYMGHME